MWTEVTPLPGRDYTTQKAALADWAAGKDFILQDVTSRWDGKPVNKQDADRAGLRVIIRYGNLRKTVQAPAPCADCGC